MRQINYIVLHCTATGKDATPEAIRNYWINERGWKQPGYHFLIRFDGSYVQMQKTELMANGVSGYNRDSIHISYIGGINSKGQPLDTRSQAQKDTMTSLIRAMKRLYPQAVILGHRDFPGVNKACPSFDVAKWLKEIGIDNNNFAGFPKKK